jgi:flavin reductase (DIM6/NTAB) family NADH-FMN oxidoreductase RutF
MDFDFETLSENDRYRILANTIVPRPIAWITSVSSDGVRNASPFSFFNAVSDDPPLLAVGFLAGNNGLKDTARNILDTREFVVNLVPFSLANEMNTTSEAVATDVDEISLAGLETAASLKVKPARIAASPVSFECRLHTPLTFGNRLVVLGEVVHAHVADEAIVDASPLRIDALKLDLIARMHGRGIYARPSELFEMQRPAQNGRT